MRYRAVTVGVLAVVCGALLTQTAAAWSWHHMPGALCNGQDDEDDLDRIQAGLLQTRGISENLVCAFTFDSAISWLTVDQAVFRGYDGDSTRSFEVSFCIGDSGSGDDWSCGTSEASGENFTGWWDEVLDYPSIAGSASGRTHSIRVTGAPTWSYVSSYSMEDTD